MTDQSPNDQNRFLLYPAPEVASNPLSHEPLFLYSHSSGGYADRVRAT